MTPFWKEFLPIVAVCALLIVQFFAIIWMERRATKWRERINDGKPSSEENFQFAQAAYMQCAENCTFKVACICGAAQNQPAALGDWERYKRSRKLTGEKGKP